MSERGPKGETGRSADPRRTGATSVEGHPSPSRSHMVASCPLKTQQAPSSQGKPAYFQEEEEEVQSPALLPEAQH